VWESGCRPVQVHVFLTSPLVGGERWASRPCHFTPGERASGAHWIGGWVAPTTSLDDVERRKSYPTGTQNSDPSAVQPVASLCTGCAIPAPCCCSFSSLGSSLHYGWRVASSWMWRREICSTRRHISEDSAVHSHRCENRKSTCLHYLRGRKQHWTRYNTQWVA
jgi:hypothetical protein